ncbi:MAG: hypothetical protein IT445_00170 [Phycisphaeraceae bacterium]|nr:hypothetical protein [Phycisphaeraceae bacterium]
MNLGPEKIDVPAVAAEVHGALLRRRDARRTGELPRVITARSIARLFHVRPHGCMDSKRRGVRLVMRHLRDEGVPVLSTGNGYYLGVEPADYEAAERFARRNGLQNLVLASQVKHAPERAEASGQLVMFDTRPRAPHYV